MLSCTKAMCRRSVYTSTKCLYALERNLSLQFVPSNLSNISASQNFHDKWKSIDFRPSGYVNPTCYWKVNDIHCRLRCTQPDMYEMETSKSTKGPQILTPQNISHFITDFLHDEYNKLSECPWLCADNYSIIFMQLTMNGKVEEIFDHLKDCPYFINLLEYLDKNLDNVPDEDITSLLLNLLYLGIPSHSRIAHRLFSRIYDILPSCNLATLAAFSKVSKTLRRVDYLLVEKAIQRLREILETDDIIINIQDLTMVVNDLHYSMSQDFYQYIVDKAVKAFNQSNQQHDLNAIVSILRLLCIPMVWRGQEETFGVVQYVEKFSKMAADRIQELSVKQISGVCHNLNKLWSYNGYIAEVFQKRSLELLHDDSLKVYEISSLLSAFNYHTPQVMKSEVEEIIYSKITDIDIFLVSKLVNFVVSTDSNNEKLISFLKEKIMTNFDKISCYVTIFPQSLKLWGKEGQDSFDPMFDRKLVALFKKESSVSVWFASILAKYLLPRTHLIIPDFLFYTLLRVIPQCALYDLRFISQGLMRISRPRNATLHRQILNIQSAIHDNILNRINSKISMSNLFNCVYILCLQQNMKDPMLLDSVMKRYTSQASEMTVSNSVLLTKVITKMLYYHPAIIEDISRIALSNNERLHILSFRRYLKMLAVVGHVPKDHAKLAEMCTDLSHNLIDSLDVVNLIKLAQDLSVIQIFPIPLLEHIFNFKFIEKIDCLTKSKYDLKLHICNIYLHKCHFARMLEYRFFIRT